jgi:hypothetical protein
MNATKFKSVRIKEDVYKDVADYKKKTRLPIAAFIEKAVNEKLKRIKSKKKL